MGTTPKYFVCVLVASCLTCQFDCDALAQTTMSTSSVLPLQAGVDTRDESALSRNIDGLLNSALEKKGSFGKSTDAVNHFKAPQQKTWSKVKDASNFLVPWHGTGPSSEAGDVILDEKVKLKSLESSEYARQREVDETHLAVVEKMLNLAESVGSNAGAESTQAMRQLTELTSNEEAQSTKDMILGLITNGQPGLVDTGRKPSSITQRERKWKLLSQAFIDNDPVVHEIRKRLHSYNQRGCVAKVSSHVIGTTLGIANLMPNVLAPASQGALMTYELANGGSEESKLVKELYLERRLQSRSQTLTEEAHLVLDTYEAAERTGNIPLATLSRTMMNDMGDPETTAQILDQI